MKWGHEMGKPEGETSTLYEITHWRDPVGQAQRDKEVEALRIAAARVKIPATPRYRALNGLIRVSRQAVSVTHQ